MRSEGGEVGESGGISGSGKREQTAVCESTSSKKRIQEIRIKMKIKRLQIDAERLMEPTDINAV